jgi:hypothetical protein
MSHHPPENIAGHPQRGTRTHVQDWVRRTPTKEKGCQNCKATPRYKWQHEAEYYDFTVLVAVTTSILAF